MADMDRILEIAAMYGLLVIEDCAQAHDHRWRSNCAGSLGDLGIFSFEQSKLKTAGEFGQRSGTLRSVGFSTLHRRLD
jgi:dTDP-4-amino-4,6-dideoxygalactose transaminase